MLMHGEAFGWLPSKRPRSDVSSGAEISVLCINELSGDNSSESITSNLSLADVYFKIKLFFYGTFVDH